MLKLVELRTCKLRIKLVETSNSKYLIVMLLLLILASFTTISKVDLYFILLKYSNINLHNSK